MIDLARQGFYSSFEGEGRWLTKPEKNVRIPTAAVKRGQIASTAALSALPWKRHRTSIANAGIQVAKDAPPKSRGKSAEWIHRENDEPCVLCPLNLFQPAVLHAKNIPVLSINQRLTVAWTRDVRPYVDRRLPWCDPMLHGLNANHLSRPSAVTPRSEPVCVSYLQILLRACTCRGKGRSALRASK